MADSEFDSADWIGRFLALIRLFLVLLLGLQVPLDLLLLLF